MMAKWEGAMDDAWGMTLGEMTTGGYPCVAIVSTEYRSLHRESWPWAPIEAEWKISGKKSGTCEERSGLVIDPYLG